MSMFGKDKGANGSVAVAVPSAEPTGASRPPSAKAEAVESVFGPSLVFKGDVSFQDTIRIEGELHGRITGEGLVKVTQGGKVFGDIVAARIVIHGIVQGNVTAADRLVIAATGQVGGELKCSRLTIAEGAKLIGRFDVGADS
jgi:cytoskeletal protein CcmA (bactofilin family)